MKRTVKAWALVADGVLSGLRSPYIFYSTADFDPLYAKYGDITSCTITYDDGTKPKRRKKPHA